MISHGDFFYYSTESVSSHERSSLWSMCHDDCTAVESSSGCRVISWEKIEDVLTASGAEAISSMGDNAADALYGCTFQR